MRLQRPIYAPKPVAEITLRVLSRGLPDGAEVTVSDLQLQPGEAATGAGALNPRELVMKQGRTQYRNVVIHDGMEVVVLANIDRATPTRITLRNHSGDAQVGSYRFTGNGGWADGRSHRASNGWGRPPVITERSDLYLRTHLSSGLRAHLRLEWEDRDI